MTVRSEARKLLKLTVQVLIALAVTVSVFVTATLFSNELIRAALWAVESPLTVEDVNTPLEVRP